MSLMDQELTLITMDVTNGSITYTKIKDVTSGSRTCTKHDECH